jgi:hypothetical protein
MTNKRIRTDSYMTEVDMAQAKPPEPPDNIDLPDDARPTWNAIVRAREYNAWTSVDLQHAANLACCLADIERLRREIRVEGDTLTNERGTVVMNPKHSLLEVLSRRSVALSRMLHVHAEATEGPARKQADRSKKQREMADVVSSGEDDDGLIPKPMH